MPFGREETWLSGADVTPEQQAAIDADPLIYSFPENIDTNLTAQGVQALSSYLEDVNVPAHWLNAGFSFREAIRIIAAMFQYMQRLEYLLGGRFFDANTGLNTKVSDFSPAQLSAATQAAIDLGFDTSGISGQTQIRNVMKNMADQWGSRTLNLGVAGNI